MRNEQIQFDFSDSKQSYSDELHHVAEHIKSIADNIDQIESHESAQHLAYRLQQYAKGILAIREEVKRAGLQKFKERREGLTPTQLSQLSKIKIDKGLYKR